jgi:hypothetical protein
MHSHDSLKQLINIIDAGNKQGDSRSNISMGFVPGPGGQARARVCARRSKKRGC